MNNRLSDNTVLYTTESCCGCGGCENVCPSNAISLKGDKFGTLYPDIDVSKCISCHACIKNCAYQNKVDFRNTEQGYALVNNNSAQLALSASGGAFSCIAKKMLLQGGVVCGSKMQYNESVRVEHVLVEAVEDLPEIQGSKYVQSSLVKSFPRIEEMLKSGRQVLFSGTPCQVAEIKKMFGKFSNLYTVDIICHGVPNPLIFSQYIKLLEKRHKGKVSAFSFRDKSYGWGKFGSVVVGEKKISLPERKSSYYTFFMSGDIQRENCYSCPYAKEERVGDITLGDYWGIDRFQPEILKKNGGELDDCRGISAVLVNTKKGKDLLMGVDATLYEANVRDIIAGNSQLRHPLARGKHRDMIIYAYKCCGTYSVVEMLFVLWKIIQKLKHLLKA